MAVAGVVAGKPLRLKDFLELECDSCSAAGFRCYPRRLCVAAPSTVRQCHLQLEAEAPRFGRSPSLRPKLSHLSRSLSRRLRGGFSWRRHEEETVTPVSEPCAPPEVTTSGSSDSETSESGSSSAEGKSESDFSSASSESPHAGAVQATAAAVDVHEAMKRGSKEAAGSEVDEKEQLSPVAVMDFPFDDEEEDAVVVEEGRDGGGGACSLSFSDSLAQLQSRKTQLQHKIRRLGSIVELGAVDLEARFAASDSDGLAIVATTTPSCQGSADHDEQILHGLLTATAVGVDGVSERLLLDFFAERAVPNLSTSESGVAAVRLAKSWLEGTGAQWGLKDVVCRREDLVAGMERSRRWPARVGEEEERKVGVVVASLVVDELVGELLRDLVVYVEV